VYGPGEPGRHPRPQAGQALQRALALASVAARAGLEARAADPAAAELQARMLAWLDRSGLSAALEPGEARLLAAPLGTLDTAEATDAGWRAEGAHVLAWALGRQPLQPHDRLVDPYEVAGSLGFLDAAALAAAVELRGEREIDTLLARQLAIHWRLREYALRPGPMEFAPVVASGGWARLDLDAQALAGGDLAIDGEPIDRAGAAAVERCTSIAVERHRAASWLAGADPVYADVEAVT